ncbi:MAG TPA: glycosyltransferase family 2 protein [Gammaproteobacteria bacterium]|nr:glycosyltransferase family 2 protein [Gammaproteobacteria bacterium]
MNQPEFSVIIPAYRAAATISRTLASVINHRDINVEVIVVEDGSFDNTKEIVATFPNVRLISLPVNKGVCYARNTGLANARSAFVLFLDADDALEGPILEGMIDVLRKESTDMVFAPWRFDGPSAEDVSIKHAKRVDTDEWLAAWAAGSQWAWACPSRIAWRRTSLIAIGAWNLAFPKKEDTELMVRALTAGLHFGVSDLGCSVYWRANTDTARSYTFSDEIFQCQWGIYALLKKMLLRDDPPNQKLQFGVAEFCYRIASLAIPRGNISEGKRWLREAKSLEMPRPLGVKPYSILLTVLWLKYKPSLEWQIRKLRTFRHGRGTTPDVD